MHLFFCNIFKLCTSWQCEEKFICVQFKTKGSFRHDYKAVHKSAAGGREVKCRIPRRSPANITRPAAANLAAKPAVRSSYDGNLTISRNSNCRSGAHSIRSRSQDERTRSQSPRPDRHRYRESRLHSGLLQRVIELSSKTDNVLKQKVAISKKTGTIVVQPDVIVTADDIQWRSEYEHISTKTSSISVSLRLENSQESITATADGTTVRHLQHSLTEKQIDFDKLKSELNSKQKLLSDVFTDMKVTQRQLKSLGGDSVAPDLPSYDEALMAPARNQNMGIAVPLSLSDNLNSLPCGLLECCETAVRGQKEIVQWINSLLTSKDKGIRMQDLADKVTEFTSRYKSAASSLSAARTCFANELSQAVDVLRLGQDEHEHLLQKMEHVKVEMEELKTQNVELQKQLLASNDHVKYIRADKSKVEELEKELKAEKCKRSMVRERLTRADAQAKSSSGQLAELEAQLEGSRGDVQALRTAVHQLQEENLKIQMQHDSENKKMADFVKEKTEYVEHMHRDREILEDEKIDLEHRLEEVESQYCEKITQMKRELNKANAQSEDAEVQIKELEEINLKIKLELEATNEQVADGEDKHNKLLQEKADVVEAQMKATEMLKKYESEIEQLQQKLNESQETINELKMREVRHQELKETLSKELENKEKSIMEIKKELMAELRCKNDCMMGLQKKVEELEEETQESEVKVDLYKRQLQNLKNNLGYNMPYDDEGDTMACFEGLRNLINEQRTKLLEATRQNGELAEELQRKEDESKSHEDTINTQLAAIARSDEFIEMLSKKDEEQMNAISILRSELKIKMEAELNANRKLAQKSEEISILLRNVEKRKQEIHQLEQIILTLEDQSCKMKVVKKSLQEKISILERKILEHNMNENQEKRNIMNVPAQCFDNFISILEAELGNSNYDDFRKMGQLKNRKTDRLGSRALSPTRKKRLHDDSDLLEPTLDYDTFNIADPNESAYLSDDSVISPNLNRYEIDNCDRQNINVYHTMRTDIALNNGGRGGGCGRCKSRSPVRAVQAPRVGNCNLAVHAPRAPRRHHYH